MAVAAILNLSFLSILVKWSISGGSWLHHCKISFIYVSRRLSYWCLCKKSKMATAAILDLIFVQYFGITACRTSRVIHVPNFVQICAIVNAAILNLLFLSILFKWSVSGGSCLHHCKISFIYFNRRLSFWCLCKNPRWRLLPSWIIIL